MTEAPASTPAQNACERDLTVVNVVAVSYSGSTWLNLVLGSHSQAFSVGEMDQIRKYQRVRCTVHGDDCATWKDFDMHSPVNPFVQLHELTGKKVFVVNNVRRFLPDQKHPRIRSRFIWVIRDGRAVMASALRKYPHLSNWRAARDWARSLRKKKQLLRRQPPESRLTVHYERLQQDQPKYVARMCEHCGLDYEPSMIEFWNRMHCFIGGNWGPLYQLAQAQGITLPRKEGSMIKVKPKDDRSLYKTQDPGAFRDERWKTDLTDRQLKIFALAAGRLNVSLGYPRSTDRRGLLETDG